ncbi:MAG: hypothetical protein K6E29_05060 [Cyanobacteria bacterium RUI128]|nr:hypothetical protein [Cyanobacteria bacterium RUI128]
MGNNISVVQRFTNYFTTHVRECKGKTLAEICTMMNLTPAEKEELLKNKLLLPFQFQSEEHTYGYENFGLHLNPTKKQPAQKPKQPQKKPSDGNINIREFFPGIKLTKDGKVDLNQFTMKELQKKYPSDKYDVKREDGDLVVYNKQGEKVCEVFVQDGNICVMMPVDSKTRRGLEIRDNGTIKSRIVKTKSDGVTTSTMYSGTSTRITGYGSFNNQTKMGVKTYYDDNGNVIHKERYKRINDKNTTTSEIFYSNNQPYKKVTGKKVTYPLVNDLIADITAKTKLGFPTTRASLSNNVLKRINASNVAEIVEQYKKQTGNELLADIASEWGLPGPIQKKLIEHIDNLLSENSGQYLAQKLFDDISGPGSGNLSKDVMQINKNNVKDVLVAYRELSMDETSGTYETIDTCTGFIRDLTGINITDNLAYLIAPYEGLLTAINGEWGLSKAERTRLISHIVKTVTDNVSADTSLRTKRDIANHSEDFHSVEIDLYRAINANDGTLEDPRAHLEEAPSAESVSAPTQQGGTGDCWLLAALNSAIAKPHGLNMLERLVKHDEQTGIYTVRLKGWFREYYITEQEVASVHNLSTGSKKVKAIEIAMDKLIRDLSYSDRRHQITMDSDGMIDDVDIDGNREWFLFHSLFGDSNKLTIGKTDPLTEDFNKPNNFYTFGLSGDEPRSSVVHSEKHENYKIIPNHAYSIIGSDSKNVYLLNPWDASDKLTVSRKDFKNMGVEITNYELPFGSWLFT